MSEPKHGGHGHEVPMGPSSVPESVLKTGHEPDAFDTKSILAIPAAVLAFFVIAFVTTTIIFVYVMSPSTDKSAHPLAAKENSVDLNTRLGRINAEAGSVHQPRLEGLRQREANDQSLNWTSQPVGKDNSLEFHPEDLRPTARYGKSLGLDSYGVADSKEKTVFIPIEKAMEIAVKDAKLLPSLDKEKAVDPKPSPRRPKLSNGGGQPLPSVEKK